MLNQEGQLKEENWTSQACQRLSTPSFELRIGVQDPKL